MKCGRGCCRQRRVLLVEGQSTLHQRVKVLIRIGGSLRCAPVRTGRPLLLVVTLASSRRHGRHGRSSSRRTRFRRGHRIEELSSTQLPVQLGRGLATALQLLPERLVLLFDCHEMLDLLLRVGVPAQLRAPLGDAHQVLFIGGFAIREAPRLSQSRLQILLLELKRQQNLAVLLPQLFALLIQAPQLLRLLLTIATRAACPRLL
mmetsp:Transcript_98710/g.235170  ORF Transcript_98710/g.235170 Transcript_98710/m.235170 type:complete len:204 (-) Transcript_98710:2145-2756(-)